MERSSSETDCYSAGQEIPLRLCNPKNFHGLYEARRFDPMVNNIRSAPNLITFYFKFTLQSGFFPSN